MSKKKEKQKYFKVYYFKGDFFSSEGEKRHSTTVQAANELDAEKFFKKLYPDCSFGWVELYKKEAN